MIQQHPGETPEMMQRRYYEQTAHEYREKHEIHGSAHSKALEFIDAMLPRLGAASVLDVGAGTGRVLSHLSARWPQLTLRGIEPVPALIAEGEKSGLPPGLTTQGSGDALPYADGEIDVVTCFGVLHHVPRPERVIREMMRVARRAVFISDANRFAQGRPLARFAKLALHGLGLWPAFDFIRTRGRGYMTSEGDGVFYSYSVFDSVRLLRSWTPHLQFVELETSPTVVGPWASSICNASTVLVGAIKDQLA